MTYIQNAMPNMRYQAPEPGTYGFILVGERTSTKPPDLVKSAGEQHIPFNVMSAYLRAVV